MRTSQDNKSSGFTIIELLLVLVIVLVLAAIVSVSYSSIRKNENNKERYSDITIIQDRLELYYIKNNNYPTLDEVNNSKWREDNFKQIDNDIFIDPTGTSNQLVSKPLGNTYSYSVTSNDGKECDNKKIICTQYTLEATLQGGGTYKRNNIF